MTQRKRAARQRPHKAAARHRTPLWKFNTWGFEKKLARLIDEDREVDGFAPPVRYRR